MIAYRLVKYPVLLSSRSVYPHLTYVRKGRKTATATRQNIVDLIEAKVTQL